MAVVVSKNKKIHNESNNKIQFQEHETMTTNDNTVDTEVGQPRVKLKTHVRLDSVSCVVIVITHNEAKNKQKYETII